MHIFIFIITAIILYPVLGTVFGVLLTAYKSKSDKVKICILTFLHPLLFTIILWFIFPSTFNNSLLWFAFYLLAVLIRDIIFSDRKYLSALTITNETIFIEYITPLLKKKFFDLSIGNIKNLELSKMDTFVDYPGSLKYSYDNDTHLQFVILNRKTWDLASKSLNAANIDNTNSEPSLQTSN